MTLKHFPSHESRCHPWLFPLFHVPYAGNREWIQVPWQSNLPSPATPLPENLVKVLTLDLYLGPHCFSLESCPFCTILPTLIAHVWAQAPSSAIWKFLAVSQLGFQYLVCLLPICPLSWSSREPSELPIYFVTPLLKAYPWFLIDLEFSAFSFAMQLTSFTTWFLQTHLWHFLPGVLCSTPTCLLRAPESPMCYLTLGPLHLWFAPSGMPPSLHTSPLLGLRIWP